MVSLLSSRKSYSTLEEKANRKLSSAASRVFTLRKERVILLRSVAAEYYLTPFHFISIVAYKLFIEKKKRKKKKHHISDFKKMQKLCAKNKTFF